MKTLHIHLSVNDLAKNIAFYSSLFKAEPTKTKEDYAKWVLSDPKVNFSISQSKEAQGGIEHLGIQVENQEELQEVYQQMEVAEKAIEGKIREEGETICCYSKSEKSWIKDPQNVEWEVFHTFADSDTYKAEKSNQPKASSCTSKGCC